MDLNREDCSVTKYNLRSTSVNLTRLSPTLLDPHTLEQEEKQTTCEENSEQNFEFSKIKIEPEENFSENFDTHETDIDRSCSSENFENPELKYQANVSENLENSQINFDEFLLCNENLEPVIYDQKYLTWPQNFSFSSDLQGNAQSSDKDAKLHQCLECGKVFKHNCSLVYHSVSHGNERPFKCKLCSMAFKYKKNLTKHGKVHARDVEFVECNEPMIKIKVEEVNEKVQQLECDICNYKCKYPLNLIKHKKMHVKVAEYNKTLVKDGKSKELEVSYNKPYKCLDCDLRFRYKSQLTSHSVIHGNVKAFICTICGVKYKQKYTLKRHMNVVHPIETTDFDPFKSDSDSNDSEASDEIVNTSKMLQNNVSDPSLDENDVKNMDENEENETCMNSFEFVECNEPSISLDNEDISDSSQSDIDDENKEVKMNIKKYNCKQCQYRFTNKKNLNHHIKFAHEITKAFICDTCNKSYTTKRILMKHIKTHSTVIPCNICGKNFSSKVRVVIHMRIHSDVKPFVCALCNKAFTYKSTLSRHMLVHSDYKPLSCEICSKNFKTNQDLRNHILVHNLEKPFACDFCQSKFRTQKHKNYHIKVAHEEQVLLSNA